jgi:aminoglycoside 3-N-acetyltransferase
MSTEFTSVQLADAPRTRQSLAADLRRLGLAPGMTVIAHSAMSRLGWVCGGPVAVVQALMDVLTPEGTLVMPAHTGEYSEPSYWGRPPVPESWWPAIRATMPAFDPQVSPTRGMGKIAETFRSFPGVLRSRHPQVSFTSWGRHAAFITADHSYDYGLGEASPLARVYDLDGHVLLLGVGHGNNTSLHLAEYRAPGAEPFTQGAPILDERGQRQWRVLQDIVTDADPFAELGAAFEQTGAVTIGKVGSADAGLMRQRAAVDFAVGWIGARRAP